ncbi:TonB family protein [Phenylobacterium sp.]|uniref:TonB family protein n=1 Tax=Phenylobacterium sp. TaxID=1871053 RepID=UPI00286D8AD8|nr:TonB family protein [Phenylobacterium sp.]
MILGILAAASVASTPLLLREALWKVRPTEVDLTRAYPEGPRLQRVGGRAEIECMVSTEGSLDACQVTSETPAGMGFGEAALKLTPRMVLHPEDRAGASVAGRAIRIPIRWAPPPAPPEGRPIDPANVVWVRTATSQDLAQHFPDQAAMERVQGRGTVLCRITPEFTLAACAVTEEEPYGYGFGIAVQTIAAQFKIAPKGKDGSTIMPGDILPLKVRFVLPR